MNVVKGASGDVCGLLSAFGEAFLCMATSAAVRPLVHMMPGWKSWPHELASRSAHRSQVATTRPPAARMTSPVIQADSSDARNTASGAISVTRPSRSSGVFPARTAPAPPSKVLAATYIAFRFCMTGSDGVDAYLARRQFERQSPGQRFDGAFRGGVKQGSPHRMRTTI